MISRAITFLLRTLVIFYQRLLSPALKAFTGCTSTCRFTPTCSHYFLQALESHGPMRGTILTTKRLCKCHPWGSCGHDPVPLHPSKQTNH